MVNGGLNSPGSTVPTEGETVTGAPSGTTNSKEVGPTGAISPKTNFRIDWTCDRINLFNIVTHILAHLTLEGKKSYQIILSIVM